MTGTYELRLTADDGDLSSSDEVTIEVKQGQEVRITSSTDDAEERSLGHTNLTSPDLELVFDSGSNQLVGLRFPGITIDQGTTIETAYIRFQVDEISAGAISLAIEGEDID